MGIIGVGQMNLWLQLTQSVDGAAAAAAVSAITTDALPAMNLAKISTIPNSPTIFYELKMRACVIACFQFPLRKSQKLL